MRSIFYIGFVLLVPVWACNDTTARNSKKAEPISCVPGAFQDIYNLNWRQPTVNFKISLDSLKKKGGILSITIKEVNNPGLVPVSFKLFFTDSFKQWTIPGFTLYPPDKAGVFNFNISKTVKDILKSGNKAKSKQYSLRIILDTANLSKKDNAGAKSLLIKIGSPVFK